MRNRVSQTMKREEDVAEGKKRLSRSFNGRLASVRRLAKRRAPLFSRCSISLERRRLGERLIATTAKPGRLLLHIEGVVNIKPAFRGSMNIDIDHSRVA